MSNRYIPPSARRKQEGNGDISAAETTKQETTNNSEALEPRSLERLSLSHPDGRSFEYRGRGRGRFPGPGRGRGSERGRGRGRGGYQRGRGNGTGFKAFTNRPPADDEFYYREIHEHFWSSEHPRPAGERSTLNDSYENQNQLVFVMLFKDANPRWEDDHVIFAHTSIDILPGYEKAYENAIEVEMDEESQAAYLEEKLNGAGHDHEEAAGKPNKDKVLSAETGNAKSTITTHDEDSATAAKEDKVIAQSGDGGQSEASNPKGPLEYTRTIAIFSQNTPGRDRSTVYFRFLGWYKLKNVTFLHPRSKDLAKMMVQKWDIKDKFGRTRDIKRDRTGWLKSMSQRWAVLEFEELAPQDPMPSIERLPQDTVGGYSRGHARKNSAVDDMKDDTDSVGKREERARDGDDGHEDKNSAIDEDGEQLSVAEQVEPGQIHVEATDDKGT